MKILFAKSTARFLGWSWVWAETRSGEFHLRHARHSPFDRWVINDASGWWDRFTANYDQSALLEDGRLLADDYGSAATFNRWRYAFGPEVFEHKNAVQVRPAGLGVGPRLEEMVRRMREDEDEDEDF